MGSWSGCEREEIVPGDATFTPQLSTVFFGVRGEERCKGVCNIALPTFKTVNMVNYVHEQGNGAFTLTFQVANLLSFPFAMHCQNTKIGLKSVN